MDNESPERVWVFLERMANYSNRGMVRPALVARLKETFTDFLDQNPEYKPLSSMDWSPECLEQAIMNAELADGR